MLEGGVSPPLQGFSPPASITHSSYSCSSVSDILVRPKDHREQAEWGGVPKEEGLGVWTPRSEAGGSGGLDSWV